MDIRVLDVFAGAGGFSLGFRGFVKAAIENHPHVVKTYLHNFPDVFMFAEDVKRISGRVVREAVGEVDVVVGGPPCESFTSMNPRRRRDPLDRLMADPQGRLVLEFIRLVEELKPKVYIMENVPEMIDEGLDKVLERLFARLGYKAYFNLLEAHKYGTSSRRVRLFVSNVWLELGDAEDGKVVEEALRGLPPLGEAPNHRLVRVGRSRAEKIKRLRWGQALYTYRNSLGRVHRNWLRLHPRRLAPSIHGRSRFIHPFEDRVLTVREQARLMGFPDTHVFYGGVDRQFDQVGEAVPPPLSKRIARAVIQILPQL